MALDLLRRLLPEETHRIAEELVWWRLVLDYPPGERITDIGRATHDHRWDEGPLRDQFQIATRGYADPADANTASTAHEGTVERPNPLASRVEDHEAEVTALIDRAMSLLGSNPRSMVSARLPTS